LVAFYDGGGPGGGSSEALRLLERVIASQDAEPSARAELLGSLQANSASVLPLLDQEAADSILAAHAEHLDPAWLCQILTRLLEPDQGPLDAEMTASLDDTAEARSDRAAEVGSAFAELLLPSLTEELKDFAAFFAGLPEVDPEIYSGLLDLPEVRHAGESAFDLARFGIIPSTISEAALALSTLAAESGVRDDGTVVPVILDLRRDHEREHTHRDDAIVRDEAVGRIAFVTDLWPESCDRLLDWIAGALVERPMLVKGFRADPDDRGYRLIWLDHPRTLEEQWHLGPKEAAEL
jgi:hypothetical protein